MNEKRKFGVRDMVLVGMLAAMCTIATMIKVPFGVGAMVHLGSASIYTLGIVFGGIYAGLAGAIGSAFFDLLLGFSPYTVWSFFIKGIAGFVVGIIAKGMWPEDSPRGSWLARAILGCVAAATWTLGGYIIAWTQVAGSLAVAIANAPSSLMTSGAGIIVALVLSPKLRNAFNRR